jgi:hypothetical protein
VEEAQERRARARDGKGDGERDHAGRKGDNEHPATASAAGETSAHCAREGRRGGYVEMRR